MCKQTFTVKPQNVIACILSLFDVKFIRPTKKSRITADIHHTPCTNPKRGGINLFAGGGGGGPRDKLISRSKGGEG